MDDDDILTEDIVTLTRSQWEDLMRSIQSLSQANAKLVETLAYLLRITLAHAPEVQIGDTSLIDVDPYDLAALRNLIEGVE